MSLLRALNLPKPLSGGPGLVPPSAAGSRVKQTKLAQGASDWRTAHVEADQRIAALKKTILKHYAEKPPAVFTGIQEGIGQLDAVLDTIDQELADLMTHASETSEESTRVSKIGRAKALLAEHIRYIRSEPLITQIDQNPFGVQTNLRSLLVSALTDAAKALG